MRKSERQNKKKENSLGSGLKGKVAANRASGARNHGEMWLLTLEQERCDRLEEHEWPKGVNLPISPCVLYRRCDCRTEVDRTWCLYRVRTPINIQVTIMYQRSQLQR